MSLTPSYSALKGTHPCTSPSEVPAPSCRAGKCSILGVRGLHPRESKWDCEFPFSPLAVTGPAVPLGSGGGGSAAGRPEGAAGQGPGEGSAGEPVPSLHLRTACVACLWSEGSFQVLGYGAFLFYASLLFFMLLLLSQRGTDWGGASFKEVPANQPVGDSQGSRPGLGRPEALCCLCPGVSCLSPCKCAVLCPHSQQSAPPS